MRLFSNIAAAMAASRARSSSGQLIHFARGPPGIRGGVRRALKTAHGYEADTISTAAE